MPEAAQIDAIRVKHWRSFDRASRDSARTAKPSTGVASWMHREASSKPCRPRSWWSLAIWAPPCTGWSVKFSVCCPKLCCPGQQGVRWQGFQVWRCGKCTGSHHLLKQRSAPTPPCRPWQQGWTVAPPTPMQDPSVDASTCKTNHSALQSWWTWNLKNRKKQKNRQFQDYTAQHSYVSTSAICNCTYLGICQRIYILHVKALYTCYDRKYLSTKMWLWYAWNRDRSQLRRTNWWCKWWWSNINSMMFEKKTPSWK